MFSEYNANLTSSYSHLTNSTFSNQYGTSKDDNVFSIGTEDANDFKIDDNGNRLHVLKISLIQKYFIDNPYEHRLKLFGDNINMFKLVGLVRNLIVDDSTDKWGFTLDDGTGYINVKWRVTHNKEYQEKNFSPWFKDQLKLIKNNTYVRVFGDINLLGHLEPHVSAYTVSSVEFPQEIIYHETEVIRWIAYKALKKTSVDDQERRDNEYDNGINSTISFANLKNEYNSIFSKDFSSIPPSTTSTSASTYSSSHVQSTAALKSSPISRSRTPPISKSPFNYNTSPITPKTNSVITTTAKDNYLSNSILEIITNMSVIQPNGLYEVDILIQLVGRGINVKSDLVKTECSYLASVGAIYQDESGRWRI